MNSSLSPSVTFSRRKEQTLLTKWPIYCVDGYTALVHHGGSFREPTGCHTQTWLREFTWSGAKPWESLPNDFKCILAAAHHMQDAPGLHKPVTKKKINLERILQGLSLAYQLILKERWLPMTMGGPIFEYNWPHLCLTICPCTLTSQRTQLFKGSWSTGKIRQSLGRSIPATSER